MKYAKSNHEYVLAFLVTLLSLLVLAVALSQVYRHNVFGTLVYVAREFESGRPVTKEAKNAALHQAELVRDRNICQSEFVTAGMTSVLLDLDTQDQTKNYDAWTASITAADQFARFALSCRPTDGNLWLRLAMIRQAVIEQPVEIARLITFSQLYAPAERNVLSGRYELYNRITAATLDLMTESLEADIKLVCSPQGQGVREGVSPPNRILRLQIALISPECALLKR